MVSGEDVDALITNGKSPGREWLKGRHGKCAGLASSSSAPTDPYLEDLTVKIRRELEVDLEAKVNRKVQDNMAMFLKKLGEANPDLNLDVGDYSATHSSEDVENATPLTVGTNS